MSGESEMSKTECSVISPSAPAGVISFPFPLPRTILPLLAEDQSANISPIVALATLTPLAESQSSAISVTDFNIFRLEGPSLSDDEGLSAFAIFVCLTRCLVERSTTSREVERDGRESATLFGVSRSFLRGSYKVCRPFLKNFRSGNVLSGMAKGERLGKSSISREGVRGIEGTGEKDLERFPSRKETWYPE